MPSRLEHGLYKKNDCLKYIFRCILYNYYNLRTWVLAWMHDRFLGNKSSVIFQLDNTLIRPYHIIEVIILVLNSPHQSLHLIHFPDHLAVHTSSECPIMTPTIIEYQYRMAGNFVGC